MIRVGRVAQAVAHEVEGEDDEHHRQDREQQPGMKLHRGEVPRLALGAAQRQSPVAGARQRPLFVASRILYSICGPHLKYAYTHTKVVMTDFSRAIIRMFVERILDEVLPDETGAARLQQIGLFTLVYALQDDKEPVTAARLAALTQQSASQIGKQLQKLMAIDLIERTQVLNRQGRGFAWHLSIKDTEKTRKLRKAIEQKKR